MDSIDINYFIHVANLLSFSKAADVLYVSQSSISKKIHNLELELGITLFNRNSKKVELTPAGKMLKDYFDTTTHQYHKILEEARKLENYQNKTIHIGMIEGWDISKYTAHFSEGTFANYDIVCDKINSLVKLLVRKEIDLLIGPYKGINQALEVEGIKYITVEALIKIPRIIYFSKNHFLANKQDLQLIDFKDDIFYTGKSKVAKENAIRIALNHGFNPNREPVINHSTVLVKLMNGSGYALSDDFSTIKNNQQINYFYIDDYQEVGICYINENLDFQKRKYIEEIKTIFSNYSKNE